MLEILTVAYLAFFQGGGTQVQEHPSNLVEEMRTECQFSFRVQHTCIPHAADSTLVSREHLPCYDRDCRELILFHS